jgi:molybdenum cofactor biosynthesis protein B
MGHLDHKAAAPSSVRCFVLTVSDTRNEDTDTGGRAIIDLLRAGGHEVTGRKIVRDDPDMIRTTINGELARTDVQVVITTGGTGISTRDCTFETIDAMLEKRLDGFGELFRMLSYRDIGAAAMLSRATAGTAKGKIIFSVPGSENAVRLAMTELILPEMGHALREVSR